MPPANPVEAKPRSFSVEEANRALPLVKAIVGDIVRQFELVNELKQRLASVQKSRKRPANDPYAEETAQSQAELDTEESKLATYHEELTRLGVVLKGPGDGLCDFPTVRDGREVYLCWRLGEPEVKYWHEKNAGFSGRQPLDRPTSKSNHRVI